MESKIANAMSHCANTASSLVVSPLHSQAEPSRSNTILSEMNVCSMLACQKKIFINESQVSIDTPMGDEGVLNEDR